MVIKQTKKKVVFRDLTRYLHHFSVSICPVSVGGSDQKKKTAPSPWEVAVYVVIVESDSIVFFGRSVPGTIETGGMEGLWYRTGLD